MDHLDLAHHAQCLRIAQVQRNNAAKAKHRKTQSDLLYKCVAVLLILCIGMQIIG